MLSTWPSHFVVLSDSPHYTICRETGVMNAKSGGTCRRFWRSEQQEASVVWYCSMIDRQVRMDQYSSICRYHSDAYRSSHPIFTVEAVQEFARPPN